MGAAGPSRGLNPNARDADDVDASSSESSSSDDDSDDDMEALQAELEKIKCAHPVAAREPRPVPCSYTQFHGDARVSKLSVSVRVGGAEPCSCRVHDAYVALRTRLVAAPALAAATLILTPRTAGCRAEKAAEKAKEAAEEAAAREKQERDDLINSNPMLRQELGLDDEASFQVRARRHHDLGPCACLCVVAAERVARRAAACCR